MGESGYAGATAYAPLQPRAHEDRAWVLHQRGALRSSRRNLIHRLDENHHPIPR